MQIQGGLYWSPFVGKLFKLPQALLWLVHIPSNFTTCNNTMICCRILDEGVAKAIAPAPEPSVFSVTRCALTCLKDSRCSPPKLHVRSIIHELLWFLQGNTNIAYLRDNNVSIWDEWADEDGNLRPVYGHQWRSWTTAEGNVIDQISQVVEQIKTNPDSRRLIVSAWNVGDIPKMALPCHLLFPVLCGRWQTFLPTLPAQC